MKKFLTFLFLVSVMVFGAQSAKAMKYDEAMAQSKPMAILVYADWADSASTALQVFKSLEQKYNAQYNFVPLNIATADAKSFNKTYHIYPNMPYVLLFKDRGKISRYLQQNCAIDSACFEGKLKMFIN